MTKPASRPFTIIGENIHCTRKLKREGPRIKTAPDGRVGVAFDDPSGKPAIMPLPEKITSGPVYQQGSIPHVAAAVELGMNGNAEERAIGEAYILWLADRQVRAGAHYLDVNVDEISPDVGERERAMSWVVSLLTRSVKMPLSIDSSGLSTLEVGLEAFACSSCHGAMLNSASLERPEALRLAARFGSPTILMTSGPEGLPSGVDDRLANLDSIADLAHQVGLKDDQLYADPLIYTVSAEPTVGVTVLETIRKIRAKYPTMHIAGGHSNVSFGLPNRRLLNAVWLSMAIEAGVDSGLIDPLTCHPDDVARIDPDSEAVTLARNGFLGKDEHFVEYIMAHREGRLKSPF